MSRAGKDTYHADRYKNHVHESHVMVTNGKNISFSRVFIPILFNAGEGPTVSA
jgi:hypothetical protein